MDFQTGPGGMKDMVIADEEDLGGQPTVVVFAGGIPLEPSSPSTGCRPTTFNAAYFGALEDFGVAAPSVSGVPA